MDKIYETNKDESPKTSMLMVKIAESDQNKFNIDGGERRTQLSQYIMSMISSIHKTSGFLKFMVNIFLSQCNLMTERVSTSFLLVEI